MGEENTWEREPPEDASGSIMAAMLLPIYSVMSCCISCVASVCMTVPSILLV